MGDSARKLNVHSSINEALKAGNVILSPPFPLGREQIDSCWTFDPTGVPLADQMRLELIEGRPIWPFLARVQYDSKTLEKIDKVYADAYEDIQLAFRLVDWLVSL